MRDDPDILRLQLHTVGRRIDRFLDNRDKRGFIISCQQRAQLLHRLAVAEATADEAAPVA